MEREKIKKISEILETLDTVKTDIESLRDEEQESFDNIPKNLIGNETAQALEDVLNNLEEALNNLDEVSDILTVIE